MAKKNGVAVVKKSAPKVGEDGCLYYDGKYPVHSSRAEWQKRFQELTECADSTRNKDWPALCELHHAVTVKHKRDVTPLQVENMRQRLTETTTEWLENELWRDEPDIHIAPEAYVAGRISKMFAAVALSEVPDASAEAMLVHVMTLEPSCYALESALWNIECTFKKCPSIPEVRAEIQKQIERWDRRLEVERTPSAVHRKCDEILEALKTPPPPKERPLSEIEIRERHEQAKERERNKEQERRKQKHECNEKQRAHFEALAQIERQWAEIEASGLMNDIDTDDDEVTT